MLTIIYNISGIFDSIILLIYYQTMFKKRKYNIPLPVVFIAFLLAHFLYGHIINSFTGDVSSDATYFRTMIYTFIIFILSFFYACSFFQRILIVMCFNVILTISEGITSYIITHVSDINATPYSIPESSFIAISLIVTLMSFLLIMVLCIFVGRTTEIHSVTYTLLLLLIPVLSESIALTPSFFSFQYSNPDAYLLLIFFLLIINIANYILLNNVLKAESLEQTEKQLRNQITYQHQKYTQLSEAYRSIRSFMHDTKKHLFYIEKCVNDKEYDKIIPYSKETMKDLESRYCRINTGNLVIDAFISNYILQTSQHGIDLTTNLKIDCNTIPIDDYHLTIILGNLLDNALNACLQQNYGKINIAIQTVENTFTIYITNTYIIPPDENPLENIEEIDFIHGYGLKNVKNSVAACGGIILINYEKSIYSVSIIFPLTQL